MQRYTLLLSLVLLLGVILLLVALSSLSGQVGPAGIQLRLVSRTSTRDPAVAVAVEASQRRIYVAAGHNVKEYIEILPGYPIPTLGRSVSIPGYPVTIQTDGAYVYVASDWNQQTDSPGGVYAIYTKQRHIVHAYEGPFRACGLQLKGDHVYATFWSGGEQQGGLYVLDRSLAQVGSLILDPCAGLLECESLFSDLAVLPPRAYLVNASFLGFAMNPNGALWTVDISQPDQPQLVQAYGFPGGAVNGMHVIQSYAYVAEEGESEKGRLSIVDLSNPAEPRIVGHLDTPHVLTSVAVSLPFAFATDAAGGVWVIDVSSPANPVLATYYNTGFPAYDILVHKSYVYVANGKGGLAILRIRQTRTLAAALPSFPSLLARLLAH